MRYGTECTLGYLDLLEHVLVVRRGIGWARAGEELSQMQPMLSSGKYLIEHCAGSPYASGAGLSWKVSSIALLQHTEIKEGSRRSCS